MGTLETRQFTVHPHILFSIIQSQAGTLGKALLEGVMNAIDAGATALKVSLCEDGFELVDDGKGFTTKEEIINWFGQFGTPHEEGDSIYGKFRMGRGQLMSFAVNTWRTGTFEMAVDVQNRGLDYDLKEGLRAKKGCTIAGRLYKPLSKDELAAVCSEFESLVKFSQIPIRFNGKVISKKPSELKWDAETDDAYIKITKDEGLRVYNLGVLVREYSNWEYGCGGIVVSKRPLEVNFARNDILMHKCETWRRIRDFVKKTNLTKVARKASLSKEERSFLAKQMQYGYMSGMAEKLSLKVITDATGRHHSIDDLLRASQVSTITESQGRTGSQLHRNGAAFVVAEETLKRFQVDSLREFMDVIQDISGVTALPKAVPFEELAINFSENFNEVPYGELTVADRLAFEVVCGMHDKFLKWYQLSEKTSGRRELHVGESNVADAWTDGSTYVYLHRKLLSRAVTRGARGFMELLLVLTHEYCHDTADLESHTHDLHFFNKHHDILHYGGAGRLMTFALEMEKSLTKLMAKAGCAPVKAQKAANASARSPIKLLPAAQVSQLGAHESQLSLI